MEDLNILTHLPNQYIPYDYEKLLKNFFPNFLKHVSNIKFAKKLFIFLGMDGLEPVWYCDISCSVYEQEYKMIFSMESIKNFNLECQDFSFKIHEVEGGIITLSLTDCIIKIRNESISIHNFHIPDHFTQRQKNLLIDFSNMFIKRNIKGAHTS